MSADAWRVCPRCKVRAKQKHDAALREAVDLYGKMPMDDYVAKIKSASKEPKELEETLREDYELRTSEEGDFYVRYFCHCEACGFEHKFRHEQQLDLK